MGEIFSQLGGPLSKQALHGCLEKIIIFFQSHHFQMTNFEDQTIYRKRRQV